MVMVERYIVDRDFSRLQTFFVASVISSLSLIYIPLIETLAFIIGVNFCCWRNFPHDFFYWFLFLQWLWVCRYLGDALGECG